MPQKTSPDAPVPNAPEARPIAERLAIAAYLEDAIAEMRKRVWAPHGSHAKLVEMKDGAVPCWWLKQEIDRLRLPNAKR